MMELSSFTFLMRISLEAVMNPVECAMRHS